MLAWLLGFAVVHSGLAALRVWGEARIGARLYRVIFALASLGIAVPMLAYFLNHRYDGAQLWQVQGVPGVHTLVWVLTGVSFLFLYPATFNLGEVAALQKPQVHLFSTGIIRITRHPQTTGQILWCLSHTLWIGSSFMVVTSLGLIAHHLFSTWHGDRRLHRRYGDAFVALKAHTSLIPFLAILQGRQTLVWQEFLRPAYLGVAFFTGLFYWGHPWMLAAAGRLNG